MTKLHTKLDTKLQVATNLPKPPSLTPEALREIDRQAAEWRSECAGRIKEMETMSNEKQDKVRLSLEITTELDDELGVLATEIKGTKADVLRKALALIRVAVDGKKQGLSLAIVDQENNVITTITGL